MNLLARLRAYLAHPDPRIAGCNRIAAIVVSNQPFYPLYLWWLVGGDWPVSLLTWLSTPVFAAVPWAARRKAEWGPALLVLAGFGNGIAAQKALGVGSGVELFLVPEALIAALALRALAPGLAFALVAGAAATFELGHHLGAPLGFFTAAQTDAMWRIDAFSAGALTLLVLATLAPVAKAPVVDAAP